MLVYTIGLNHSSAPVAIREQTTIADARLVDALQQLKQIPELSEVAILSTCNRTEISCLIAQDKQQKVVDWLCQFHQIDLASIAPYLYQHCAQDAIEHTFRVAAGLDSMMLGESQILGQMKTAFAQAHKHSSTGKVLNRLFQTAFSVAKEVRTSTNIGNHAVSVAYTAVSLAKQIFADIRQQTVLVIGAGETIELVCKHLVAQGVTQIIIANRTLDRAELLAQQFNAQAISLHELPTRLPEADMVLSSTSSTLPILGKGAFESALKQRKNQAVFVVDLAVPRDVEPEVGDLNNVYLYSIDDLQQVVDGNIQQRRSAAQEAEKIIVQYAQQFSHWQHNLHSLPTLKLLREQTSEMTDTELRNALKRLQVGDDPAQVLEQFAHVLSQKFMHHPTESLRQSNDDTLLHATRKLFALDNKRKLP